MKNILDSINNKVVNLSEKDKLVHLILIVIITFILNLFLSLFTSIIISFILIFLKELIDKFIRKGIFSWKDILFGIIGIIIYILIKFYGNK